jgi:hypothetical protein
MWARDDVVIRRNASQSAERRARIQNTNVEDHIDPMREVRHDLDILSEGWQPAGTGDKGQCFGMRADRFCRIVGKP